jgi:hypothetical protein
VLTKAKMPVAKHHASRTFNVRARQMWTDELTFSGASAVCVDQSGIDPYAPSGRLNRGRHEQNLPSPSGDICHVFDRLYACATVIIWGSDTANAHNGPARQFAANALFCGQSRYHADTVQPRDRQRLHGPVVPNGKWPSRDPPDTIRSPDHGARHWRCAAKSDP